MEEDNYGIGWTKEQKRQFKNKLERQMKRTFKGKFQKTQEQMD